MISIGIVGATSLIVIVISFTHKGSGKRSRLLRWAAVTMFVTAVLREVIPLVGDPPWLDLIKRLVFLATQICSILLVLTFRPSSVSRRTAVRIWIAGGVVALTETLLLAMHLRAGGTLGAYQDAAGAATAYYGLYELTLIVTALVVGGGCWRALLRSRQPFVARLSLLLIGIAAMTTVAYMAIGTLALFGHPFDGGPVVRQQLFLTTIVLLLAGLSIGGLRKIVVSGQEALMVNTATDIVEPLWRTVTALHPDVVLHSSGFSKRERLIRLVVETHDALNLIRRDPDAALNVVRDRYTSEPQLTAGLLMHLLGERAMPDSPSRRATLMMRAAGWIPDQALMASILDLYAIRLACATRDQWWIPARFV